ncbi:MAG: hypothetical protein ACFB21_02600 [Opitutales bacterium]
MTRNGLPYPDNRRLLIWLLLCLSVSTLGAKALFPTNTLESWHLAAGSATPPEQLAEFGLNNGGIRLEWTFDATASFIGLRRFDPPAGPVRQVSFEVESAVALDGVVLLTDATGETHQARWEAAGGPRQRIYLTADATTFNHQWGGDGDGRIQFPLKSITFGISRVSPPQGTVTFRDIRYTDADYSDAGTIAVTSTAPSGVFHREEPGSALRVTVKSELPERRRFAVTANYRYADGRERSFTDDVMVNANGSAVATLPVDVSEMGYAAVEVVLSVDDSPADQAEYGVAVVTRPPRADVPSDESFFGICFMEDMMAAKRMGVRFVRTLQHWKWTELSQDQYYRAEIDEFLSNVKNAGLDAMITAVVRLPPDWAAHITTDKLVKPANLKHYEGFLEFVAERMDAHDVDGPIEIQNEPDVALWYVNSLEQWQAQQTARTLIDEGVRILNAASPGREVLGVGMSGWDFRMDLQLTRSIFETGPTGLDYIAVHPYTLDRYFGSGQPVEWPDSGYLEDYWARMQAFAATGTRGGGIWSSELGWAAQIGLPLLSDDLQDLAAVLSQTMVISKAAPGVEKLAWFTGQLGWVEDDHDYSIFRRNAQGEWFPTPPVSAFATVAAQLEGADFIGELDLGNRVRAFRFRHPDSEQEVIALWTREGEVRVETPTTGVTHVGLYGREQELRNQPQLLGRAPAYLRLPAGTSRLKISSVAGQPLAETEVTAGGTDSNPGPIDNPLPGDGEGTGVEDTVSRLLENVGATQLTCGTCKLNGKPAIEVSYRRLKGRTVQLEYSQDLKSWYRIDNGFTEFVEEIVDPDPLGDGLTEDVRTVIHARVDCLFFRLRGTN